MLVKTMPSQFPNCRHCRHRRYHAVETTSKTYVLSAEPLLYLLNVPV